MAVLAVLKDEKRLTLPHVGSVPTRLGQYPHQKDIISYPYPWAKKDIISYQYPQKFRDIYHILYHIHFWRENMNGIGVKHILFEVMTT